MDSDFPLDKDDGYAPTPAGGKTYIEPKGKIMDDTGEKDFGPTPIDMKRKMPRTNSALTLLGANQPYPEKYK